MTTEYTKVVNFYENIKQQTRIVLKSLSRADVVTAEEITTSYFSEIRDMLGDILEIGSV